MPGKKLIKKEILGTNNISVSELPKGMYLVQINTEGLIEVMKMVKE